MLSFLLLAASLSLPNFSHDNLLLDAVSNNTGAVKPTTDFFQYVESLGFEAEEHFITTDDGYILRAFRLPGDNASAPVVVFQHGILASSWCWLVNDVEKSPALAMRKLGYDVWLTNSRGNSFSTNHTTLSPKSKEFWNFTFADMGRYDVPAHLEFITNHTGHDKVAFIGWSQGTTQMFLGALVSDKADVIRQKTAVFIALSPVTYLYHCKSLLLSTVAKLNIGSVLYSAYPYSFLEGGSTMSAADTFLCKVTLGVLCHVAVDTVCGKSDLDDTGAIESLSAKFPAGTSTKDLNHFEQFIQKDGFGEYDYGARGNQIAYNTTTPPTYNLSSFDLPVALFMGSNDDLVPQEDAAKLLSLLPETNVVFQKVFPGFSHVTWLVGKDEAWYYFDDVKVVVKNHIG